MSERDLAILDDEAQQSAKDDAAADELATKAGDVEVWRCRWTHVQGEGCANEGAEACGIDDPDHRVLVRVDPPYSAARLRSIQRVEWGSWWGKRRKGTQ